MFITLSTERLTMKNLFLGLIVASLSAHAMDKNGRVSTEDIEAMRKMSCEIAFKRFYKNALNMSGDGEILLKYDAERNIYQAFEFISKHCMEQKVSPKVLGEPSLEHVLMNLPTISSQTDR